MGSDLRLRMQHTHLYVCHGRVLVPAALSRHSPDELSCPPPSPCCDADGFNKPSNQPGCVFGVRVLGFWPNASSSVCLAALASA